MLKKWNVLVLTFVLVFSMGLTVSAETGGVGNTDGAATTANQNGVTGYRTAAADNDVDWGWIGLIGLAGLAGLTGRNRNQNPTR